MSDLIMTSDPVVAFASAVVGFIFGFIVFNS
jgi:hypothetical protein